MSVSILILRFPAAGGQCQCQYSRRDFCIAIADSYAHAELMLLFVEQGYVFILEYRDIDPDFCSVLLVIASRTIEVISSLPVQFR